MTDPQPDFKAILKQLHHNLNILLEREAKYGGSAPVELLTQIDDHRDAIDLTEQAGRGDLPAADWREKLKPLLVDIRQRSAEHPQWGVSIGDVSGGIIGSEIIGRDKIQIGTVTLNIVPIEVALGHALPQRNLPALRHTLQTALPHLDPPQQAATRAALDQLERQLAALPQHETDYLQRMRAKTADMYVELSSHTTETDQTPPPLSRSDRRRRERAQTHYCELVETGRETKQVILNTLRAGADKYPTIILLGDPGSGKTSALRHLAHQFAAESGKYIPLFLRLSEFGPGQTLEAFIHHSWRGSLDSNHWAAPELADNLSGYLEAGRLFILFDALNEMPYEGYPQRALALRNFIDDWQASGNRFMVSCRVLDYGEELHGLQRVEVQPLTPAQIEEFLQRELPHRWRDLWAVLIAPGADRNRQPLLELARNPWLLTIIIDIFEAGQSLPASRAELMQKFVEIQMEDAKRKPHLRAIWLDRAVQREALSVTAFEMQQRRGSGAAMETRHVRKFIPAEVQTDPACPPDPIPDPERILTLAAGANIIELPVDRSSVRFYHQLLQEYFSARELLRRVDGLPSPQPSPTGRGSISSPPTGGIEGGLESLWRWPWLERDMPPVGERGYLDPLPPPPPTNWEETTILAAGLAPANDAQLVRALLAVNPVLAGRCLHEGQAKVDAGTRQQVIEALLATIARPEVALRVRIAAGNVLGELGDPRLGEFSAIPPGEFVMGDENFGPQHTLDLPYGYLIGQYPLTNAEYAPFIEAGGYRERRWWTAAGWQEKEESGWVEPSYWRDSRFNRLNQPVVGVSWYEAVAFCRWRTEQLAVSGQLSAVREQLATVSGRPVKEVVMRLATEAEWEKAARGPSTGSGQAADGRVFPWGDAFDAARVNMRLGEQQVNATTPVGLYPGGRSPYGLYDCAGNVREWCATAAPGWNLKKYPYELENEWGEDYLDRTNVSARVLRGGSWDYFNEDFARCASRNRNTVYFRYIDSGFRVVVSPIF